MTPESAKIKLKVEGGRLRFHLPLYRSTQKKLMPALLQNAQTAVTIQMDMTIADRIEVNPKVMMGKPVIKGTRIPVELILSKLGEGASEKDLLNAYPRLTKGDIQAAMRYAAGSVSHEDLILPQTSDRRSKS